MIEWQKMNDKEWVLGESIRDIVRKALATVYYSQRICENGMKIGWAWQIGEFEKKTDGSFSPRGMESSFIAAIEAAEKELGLI